MNVPSSIPEVCDVTLVAGARSRQSAPPALLVEVPHGATRAAHFHALRARLRGPFPDGLEDFFFVNTDVGAPELAERVAARFVAQRQETSALVVRCLVPRTFIDCNRVIDAATKPAASAAGEMTPGVASYVKDPDDLALLFARYAAYREVAERAFELVCGAGGLGVMQHTYAPRSIDVPVDERIVQRLREEYEPHAITKWPLRADLDLIVNAPDGTLLASEILVARVEKSFQDAGFGTARNGAYSLHPSSMGHLHARRHPGRTLCIELRRDLLARQFTPFREMESDPVRTERLASSLAAALA
jgi:hypothetical protein